MKPKSLILILSVFVLLPLQAAEEPSIARIWNEAILAAIRIDLPNPPVHARNLFHASVAMYDAWAAYDGTAVGYLYHQKHSATQIADARREAISFAVYRILAERYALSRNAPATLQALDAKMASLGYDRNNASLDTSTPAGVGNRIASLISSYFLEDGALQTRAYADLPVLEGGYAAVNPPLLTMARGTLATSVDRWQPLAITNAISQNNIPVEIVQKFLGAQWLGVRPFALQRTDPKRPWIDPGSQPRLDGSKSEAFKTDVVEIIRRSGELTPDDGVTMDISPGAWGNNTLGTNDGSGHPLNPSTGQPYLPQVVKRGDFARVLAEFWADGPNSETPPGHWNTLANYVSDHPAFVRRLGGNGPALDRLEWDVKIYFALNGALHDAACAAWSLKRYYDGGRPIEFIRYMGQRGQSTDPTGISYDPKGLPLVPGLIELVTPLTAKIGAKHFGLPVGGIAIFTWPGQPFDPTNSYSGRTWILASDWVPYQKQTFVTPAFPGYISGHSTFSRAAAEVLAAATGTPFFPGGMGTFTANAQKFLTFEKGPSQDIQLQWGTYYDAADQAGLSRLWGGIHVGVDDVTGRRVGSQCGRGAWAMAIRYFDGSVLAEKPEMSVRRLANGQSQISYQAIRGLVYEMQFSQDLSLPFQSTSNGPVRATETTISISEPPVGSAGFYRVVRNP